MAKTISGRAGDWICKDFINEKFGGSAIHIFRGISEYSNTSNS